MRAMIATSGLFSSLLMAAPSIALAQTTSRIEPPPPIMMDVEVPAGTRPRPPEDFARVAPAAPVPSTGAWVFTEERGYIWVPRDSIARPILGVPAAFLFTPEAGWAWYASPWGDGPVRYDTWVSHPWALGFRSLGRTPDGWAWGARAPRAPATARFFGTEGHFYDASGAIVAERLSGARGTRGLRPEVEHATGGGTRSTRGSAGGRAARR